MGRTPAPAEGTATTDAIKVSCCHDYLIRACSASISRWQRAPVPSKQRYRQHERREDHDCPQANCFPQPSPGTKKPIGAFALHSIYAMLAFWYYGIMAMRKNDLQRTRAVGCAAQLLRRVASRDRSRFVSEAVAANQDLDVAEIEKEFDGIGDAMAEPWK